MQAQTAGTKNPAGAGWVRLKRLAGGLIFDDHPIRANLGRQAGAINDVPRADADMNLARRMLKHNKSIGVLWRT